MHGCHREEKLLSEGQLGKAGPEGVLTKQALTFQNIYYSPEVGQMQYCLFSKFSSVLTQTCEVAVISISLMKK